MSDTTTTPTPEPTAIDAETLVRVYADARPSEPDSTRAGLLAVRDHVLAHARPAVALDDAGVEALVRIYWLRDRLEAARVRAERAEAATYAAERRAEKAEADLHAAREELVAHQDAADVVIARARADANRRLDALRDRANEIAKERDEARAEVQRLVEARVHAVQRARHTNGVIARSHAVLDKAGAQVEGEGLPARIEAALRSPRIPAEVRRWLDVSRRYFLATSQGAASDDLENEMGHAIDAAEAALSAEPTAAAGVEVPYDFDSAIRNLEHQASRADSSELNLTMLVLADVLRREAGR